MFAPEYTGERVPCVIDGVNYKALIPRPLGSFFPFYTDNELCGLLDKARALINELNIRASLYQPFADLLRLRETLYSLRLENSPAKLEHLFMSLIYLPQDTPFPHINRYVNAVDFICENISENELTCDYMCRLNSIVAEKHPGQWRDKYGYIYHPAPDAIYYYFITPPPENIADCMKEVEEFLTSPNYNDTLLSALHTYYQLFCIRPFKNASDRTSRLIFTSQLMKYGILKFPCLCFSEQIYDRAWQLEFKFSLASHIGNFPDMLKFLTNLIIRSGEKTLSLLKQMQNLYDENTEKIRRMRGSKTNILKLFEYLQTSPLIDMNTAINHLGVTYQVASTAMSKLIQLGILKLHGKLGTTRIYIYGDYIDLLK